jgi:hypothetical protein
MSIEYTAEQIGVHNTTVERSAALQQMAHDLVITNHDVCQLGTDLRKQLHDLSKDLEKIRKIAKEPHLEAGKAVDKIMKQYSVPINDAVDALDKKLRAYAVVIEQKRTAAIAAEAAAQAKAFADAPPADSTVPPDLALVSVPKPAPAPIRTRATTDLEIFNESAIPREYWSIDEAKVKAALKAGTPVAGARLITNQKMA